MNSIFLKEHKCKKWVFEKTTKNFLYLEKKNIWLSSMLILKILWVTNVPTQLYQESCGPRIKYLVLNFMHLRPFKNIQLFF